MKTVADRLRDADPLNDDSRAPDEALERIRQRVVTAASSPSAIGQGRVPLRRVVLGAVALAAGLVAVLVVFGDRGTVQAAMRFEVRLAETHPVPGLIVARVAGPMRVLYLHPEVLVTNDDIAQSWVLQDGPDRFGISVHFLEAGAQRMREATASHLGRPVAILIDGEVVAAPVVRSRIGDSAVISGDFTRAEAERIAAGINMR